MPASAWFGTVAGDLAAARQATLDAMPARCAIRGYSTVKNTRGNIVEQAEYTRATAVPCRLVRFDVAVAGQESGGVYGRSGDLIDTSATAYQLFLPWGTTIRNSDHVQIEGGDKYEVQSVDAASSYGTEVVARLTRLGLDNPQAGGD